MNNTTAASDCVYAPPLTPTVKYLIVSCYLFIIFFSIIGNILLIATITRNKAMSSVTNLLICNSAVADLLITCIPTTYEVLDMVKYDGVWLLGKFMCVFMYMSIYMSVAATIISLIFITVDRFLAIMFPYKKYLKTSMLVYIIPFIWLISFLFAIPTIFIQKVITDNGSTELICTEKWSAPFNEEESRKHYTIILFVFLYLTPLLLMSVLYAVMARKLQKTLKTRGHPTKKISESLRSDKRLLSTSHRTSSPAASPKRKSSTFRKISSLTKANIFRKSSTSESPSKSKSEKRKRRVIIMMFTITIVFATCWFPLFLLQFLGTFNETFMKCPGSIPTWVYGIPFIFQYSNSAINPFIYFTFSQTYRNGLKSMVFKLLKIKPKVQMKAKRERKNKFLLPALSRVVETDCLVENGITRNTSMK